MFLLGGTNVGNGDGLGDNLISHVLQHVLDQDGTLGYGTFYWSISIHVGDVPIQ